MNASVLVLEDDSTLRQFMVQILGDRGYRAHGAGSGPEAIAAATRSSFDLIVADVRMEGMDGLECLAALRKAQPKMRCIVITGYASEDAPGRAVRVGAEDYLYKPFKLKDFLTAIEHVLDSARERQGYLGLLGPLVRGLFGQSARPDSSWESLRDLTFHSFYVGIRSGKLSEVEALAVWDELERLEVQPGPQDRTQAYRWLIDWIAALSRTNMPMPSKRHPGQVEPGCFGQFFRRILQGELSQEQVKLAPCLRHVPCDTSVKLQELRQKVWGASLTGTT